MDIVAGFCRSGIPTEIFFFVENKTSRLYTETSFHPGDYFVFGRESKGIPDHLLTANPDRVISIPMPNSKARSLNLANCVAIVLYEAIRQQNKQGNFPPTRGKVLFDAHGDCC